MRTTRGQTRQARMRLSEWQGRTKLMDREVALALGISRPYYSQIRHGDRRPGMAVLARLERLSGIPIRAWVDAGIDEMAPGSETIRKTA